MSKGSRAVHDRTEAGPGRTSAYRDWSHWASLALYSYGEYNAATGPSITTDGYELASSNWNYPEFA